MERQRQLDHAKRGAEMPAGMGNGLDDGFAELSGELFELDLVEAAQIGRAMQTLEDGHDVVAPAVVVARV
jgi:hypothetical protein